MIASALMCAAICWMLQAWLPPNWALLGGFSPSCGWALFSYWINTYHARRLAGCAWRCARSRRAAAAHEDGAPALRLAHRHRHRDSHPHASLRRHAALPSRRICAWPLDAERKNRPAPPVLFAWPLLPAAVDCCRRQPGWATTTTAHSATRSRLPYTVNRNYLRHGAYYVWQISAPEPNYRHAVMRSFYHKGELELFNRIHSPSGFFP